MTEQSTVTIQNIKTGFQINRQINQGLSGLSYLEALGTSVVEHYGYYKSSSEEINFTYQGMILSNFTLIDFYEENSVILLNIATREYPPFDKKSLSQYILDLLKKEEVRYLDEIKDLHDSDIYDRIQDIVNNNVIGFIIFSSDKSILISCPNYEIFYNFLLGIQDFSLIIGSKKSPRSILY